MLPELLDSEFVLEIQEGFPGTVRRYVGLKAYIEEFLYALYGEFDFELIPEEFLESGDRVVTLGHQRGKAVRTEIPFDVPFVHVWTIRNGRMVHARMFTDTALFRDALTGQSASRRSA
jgi:ketosteroid isomerase-like protein